MPATDDQEKDPFEGLTLDEDFIKGAEHKEQSARARMLSARWKHTPPQDTGWRAPVTPIKRRRRWQVPVFMLLAAGLVLASLNARALHDWALGKAPGARAADQQVAVPLTASPTAAPPTPILDTTPTMQQPFAGSPADKWPSGANGIALPSAKPVGVFTTSQVAADEQLVKNYLVAAYLDPKTMAGGYPQSALDLLDPQARPDVQQRIDHPTSTNSADILVSRFNPKLAVPLTDVRVEGTVSLSGDGNHGLSIRTDYLYVYASHPVGSTEDVERTIARRIMVFRFFDPNRYQPVAPGRVWLDSWDGFTGNQFCGFTDGYLVPYFQSPQASPSASEANPSGKPVDPYDMSRLPDTVTSCALDSRQ